MSASESRLVDMDNGDMDWTTLVRREEQAVIDNIIHGHEHGHYFLIMGPKVCLPLPVFEG